MQVTFVRSLGALAALWAVRELLWPPSTFSTPTYAVLTFGFAAAGTGLLIVRKPWVIPSAILLAGSAAGYIAMHPGNNSPVVLLLWAAVIVATTDDHPRERALLVRVCASAVYGFTALAKTNPSFLAGDQIYWIAHTRQQMAWALDLARGPAGPAAALATLFSEYFLAVGLWFTRTRVVAALIGIGLHAALVPAAALGLQSVFYLAVLNLGLIAMYPAFWAPLHPDVRTPGAPASAAIPDARVPPPLGGGTLDSDRVRR